MCIVFTFSFFSVSVSLQHEKARFLIRFLTWFLCKLPASIHRLLRFRLLLFFGMALSYGYRLVSFLSLLYVLRLGFFCYSALICVLWQLCKSLILSRRRHLLHMSTVGGSSVVWFLLKLRKQNQLKSNWLKHGLGKSSAGKFRVEELDWGGFPLLNTTYLTK